jgi:hypothetical protein
VALPSGMSLLFSVKHLAEKWDSFRSMTSKAFQNCAHRIRQRGESGGLDALVVDTHPLMPTGNAVCAAIGGMMERLKPTLFRKVRP